MNWAQLTIKATKATADAASEILCAAGCGGTSVTEASKNALLVTGYVARDGRAEKAIETTIRKLAECGSFGLDLSQADLTVTDVADDDWGLSWRKFYKPLRVGKIVVKPTWEPFEANEEDVVVNVDPAMAFGTGNHPTTRLCLEVLQGVVKDGDRVADIGTGSGILAITCALLGADTVDATDIEPLAVKTAEENFDAAGLSGKITCAASDTPMSLEGEYDLVVANIIAAVILQISEGLVAETKPGGLLLVSGIIHHMANRVRTKLESLGMKVGLSKSDSDWYAFLCRKGEDK